VVAALSLLLSASPLAIRPQPILKVYRSIEVMALSGASMVGVATKIQPPAPGGEQEKVCVVFRNCITINWYGAYPETGAFLNVDKLKVDDWIKSKARILSFDGGEWVNLDDPQERFFDAQLNPVIDPDEVIRRLKKNYRDRPEIERVRAYYRPLSAEESRRLGVEPSARIAVPCDRNLERWAVRQLGSKNWINRVNGTAALVNFESPANVRRLNALLKDPFQGQDANGQPTFPVQQAARFTLTSWGVLPRE
jgi:hypothetical protein